MEMDLNGVTVLIPVHSHTPYLKEALDSINLQEFDNNIEVLIILDRPSPETVAFLSKYSSKVEIRIQASDTPGIVDALNLGLTMAKYELVARLDSDDVMHKDRLKAQYQYLKNNENVSVIGSHVEIIDENGDYIFTKKYPLSSKEIEKELPINCCLAHPSVMFRRSTIFQVGKYRKFYEFAEDYDLWLRILEVSKLANLDFAYTQYRIHEKQTSKVKSINQIAASRAVNLSYMRRHIGKHDLEESFISPLAWVEFMEEKETEQNKMEKLKLLKPIRIFGFYRLMATLKSVYRSYSHLSRKYKDIKRNKFLKRIKK